MKTIKQVVDELKASAVEIVEKEKAVTEAEEKKDEDGAKAAREQLEKAKSEFATLSTEAEAAKERAANAKVTREAQSERDKLIGDLNGLTQMIDPTTEQVSRQGFVAAEAVDHLVRQQKHTEAFYGWLQGKSIDGEARKLLTPSSDSWQAPNVSAESKDGAVLPYRIAAKVMGPAYAAAFGEKYGAKVITSLVDAVNNPSLANNLVPQEFRAQLLQLPAAPPAIMDRCTIIPSATGTITVPQLVQTDANEYGGVVMTWTSEAAQKAETEPTFGQVEIACNELSGYTEFSERILSRSAISLEPLLASLYRGAINNEVDRVIINGTGTGQPTGILNTTGVRTVNRNTANVVDHDDLVRLKHQVLAHHRNGAMWFLEDDVEERLERTTDSQGRTLFAATTASGPYDRLVGYPYVVAYNCPAIGTAGDVIYGNPSWYWLVVEEQIVVARSEHFRFRTNRVSFRVSIVVGGLPVQPRAFAYLETVTGS